MLLVSNFFDLTLGSSVLYPVEAHVNGLGTLLLQGFVGNVLTVVLSICIFVVGCGCPISIRVLRSVTSSYAFINDAPSYSSNSYAMIFFIILHTLWMGPLSMASSLFHSDNDMPPLYYVPW